MKIDIREHEGKGFKLAIPNGLVLNRLTAGVAKKFIVKYDKSGNADISTSDLNKLFKVLKDFKKKHPDLPLVEVECKDGDRVYVKL